MFLIEDSRLIACKDLKTEQVNIPATVSTIGAKAFANHDRLTMLVFPASVKTIGDASFEDCTALTDITFQDGLKRFGRGCFRNCINLKKVCFPDTVASIHSNAFQGCIRLSIVRLSKGLRRNLESQTFGGCASLEEISIPQGIQQIKTGAFSGCTALRHVFFENSDVQIEKDAFLNCLALDTETITFIEEHTIDRNAIDIRSHAPDVAGRLSNYTERHFIFDGIQCGSIEGVLQSFKCPDSGKQEEICALSGGWAKRAGSQYEWKEKQMLYWKGQAFPRRSQEYQYLLDRLYLSVYEQDESFRNDLLALRGKRIDHRMGLSNPSETVLSRHEFIFRLQRLIEGTLQQH